MNAFFSDRTKKFSELYSDLYPSIYHEIYSNVHDIHITGDLTQEVFLRFYQKMETIDNPRNWLRGTLRNVIMEHFKKNTENSYELDNDINSGYVNGFRDTRIVLQEAFEASENFRDERERVIYRLIAINNYTYEEVSRLLGIKKHQVYYKYQCVADRIIDYLKKKGISRLEELL